MRIAVVFGTRSFLRLFGNIGAVRTFGTIRAFGIDHKTGIDFLQRSFFLFRKALLLLFLAHTLAELAFAVSQAHAPISVNADIKMQGTVLKIFFITAVCGKQR